MDRRTVLKAAASLPLVAGGLITASTVGAIAALAEEHFTLEEERMRLERQADALYDMPGRPADPVLMAGEVHVRHRGFDERMFASEETVEEYFGERIAMMESSNYFRGAERYKATWAKRYREDRVKALAMFRGRSAAYEDWRKTTGAAELERRAGALGARCSELYEQIMDAPVRTIEDGRDKAKFIARYFEHCEIPHDAAKRLVQTILTT